jgi:hypothetical protein
LILLSLLYRTLHAMTSSKQLEPRKSGIIGRYYADEIIYCCLLNLNSCKSIIVMLEVSLLNGTFDLIIKEMTCAS